jgi:hypothetical protein
MTIEKDPLIPDISTPWKLWYLDTFDREAPPSLEASGENILLGLYELWLHTLQEGVLEDGTASFSSFSLTWGNRASTTANAGVQPSRNSALKKLRQWANLGSPDKKGPADNSNRLYPEPENALVWKLAQTHFNLLLQSSRWTAKAIDWSEEARELLARVDLLTDPGQL